jgi:hypothetical protein
LVSSVEASSDDPREEEMHFCFAHIPATSAG